MELLKPNLLKVVVGIFLFILFWLLLIILQSPCVGLDLRIPSLNGTSETLNRGPFYCGLLSPLNNNILLIFLVTMFIVSYFASCNIISFISRHKRK